MPPLKFAATGRGPVCLPLEPPLIGHGGPIAWSPRPLNLNPLGFFFWGHLKSLVHETPVATTEDFKELYRRRFN
ncbi:hypothetical protein TNCV_1787591 [Trichonephila clavipes]|nr:hypothetical protein TNCV_1787591 [Trichonephila clavipes]